MEHEGCYGCGCLARRLADVQATVEALQRELESANALLHKKNCAIGKAEMAIEALQQERDRLRRAVQEAMELIHEDIVKGDKAGRRLKAEAILDRALREAALTPATAGGDGE